MAFRLGVGSEGGGSVAAAGEDEEVKLAVGVLVVELVDEPEKEEEGLLLRGGRVGEAEVVEVGLRAVRPSSRRHVPSPLPPARPPPPPPPPPPAPPTSSAGPISVSRNWLRDAS